MVYQSRIELGLRKIGEKQKIKKLNKGKTIETKNEKILPIRQKLQIISSHINQNL